MSIRLCLCLLVALASASAVARDVKLASPGSGSCPETASAEEKPERGKHAAAPARQTRARPSLHSDSPSRAPRWHSFLPGMFR